VKHAWYEGLGPLWLSLEVAFLTTVILMLIATPLAYWLSFTKSRFKPLAEVIIALPLVLPPTVLGFYLLIAFRPRGVIGSAWESLTGGSLLFSFSGVIVASVIYSLPFVVQPLHNTFSSVGKRPLEKAYTMGLSKMSAVIKILIPLSKRGYLTAAVLGFAHTLGEFGVVLMVGGNIPNETRVVSIAIYDLVEAAKYEKAHAFSGILLIFSFFLLLLIYTTHQRHSNRGR
jgi:molybdate transport system permease protein